MSVKILYIRSLCIIITMSTYIEYQSMCVWRGEVNRICGRRLEGGGVKKKEMNNIKIILCRYT
jgi:hypothetical protein